MSVALAGNKSFLPSSSEYTVAFIACATQIAIDFGSMPIKSRSNSV
jgi:hypothetical protein